MPRRIPKRRFRGAGAVGGEALDPALLRFLVDGDHAAALKDMRARNVPGAQRMTVWMHAKLAELWRDHRAEIVREAKRRGEDEPYGAMYDRWRNGRFQPERMPPGGWTNDYEPEPDDPRLTYLRDNESD
jgi:hypothetical protein